VIDRSREMDEQSWWDLWNTSHRTKDDNDAVSSELFMRVAGVINEITQANACQVLEIACGTGSLARRLVYASYHGLDLSPAAIELARQKSLQTPPPTGASSPTFEVVDFHDWSPRMCGIDVVVCVDAIAYFRNQPFVMKKIAGLLRPHGKLVLTTINPFVYQRIRRTRGVRLESGPVNQCLSRGELHSLISQAGLRIERSYTIMPRGEIGFLRIVNSGRLNEMCGPRIAVALKRLKENAGLGQYRIVVARRESQVPSRVSL